MREAPSFWPIYVMGCLIASVVLALVIGAQLVTPPFVCPAGYRCMETRHGPVVIIDRPVSVTPGTGTMRDKD